MRTIRNSLAAFLLIAFAAISVVGVMACFPTFGGRFTRITDAGAAIVAVWRAHGLLWLWLGLLVSTVATLVLSAALTRRRAMVEVEMEDGRVVILETAIRKYIRQSLAGLPGVTGHQIRLKHSRKGLHVDIFAQVRTHEKLPKIENAIINKVRSAMSEDLGIKSVSAVHVYIRDFEIATKPTPRPEPVEAAAPAKEEAASDEPPQLTRLKVVGADEEPSAGVPEPAADEDSPAELSPTDREPEGESLPVTEPDTDTEAPEPATKGWGLFRKKKTAPSETESVVSTGAAEESTIPEAEPDSGQSVGDRTTSDDAASTDEVPPGEDKPAQ